MSSELLVLAQVDKAFPSGSQQINILQQLNFSLKSGELVTVCGQSGCGKSTLLSLIGGIDRVNAGNIFFQGKDITKMSERQLNLYRRRDVAMVFQAHYLLKELTALENVQLPALINGMSGRESRDRAVDLLGQVGLSDRLRHYPYQLSGGECQRVAVARCLINQPLLVLADEPTGNLDEYNALAVEELLFEVLSNNGSAVLLVTHDQRLAQRGQRCLTLHKGRLQQQ